MSNIMEDSIAALSKFQIANFFEKSNPTTQQQCDQRAEQLAGTSVRPTPVQGADSYTVVSDDETCVVQFRASDSVMDMDLIDCVEKAYTGFTPSHCWAGNLGQLYVYTMNNVGGIAMYLARDRLNENNFSLLRHAVSDFARFFASAWHNTPSSMQCPSRSSLLNEYSSDLSKLRQGLPTRFHLTLDYLIPMLPRLLANDWPLVPNHADLLENNIHVSMQTGRLMGICDWKDAVIGPFGMSLGGLEAMLGIRTVEESWRYHPNQQELRDLFWETFYHAMGEVTKEQRELIEVARLVGLFLENGLQWTEDGFEAITDESNHDLRYLEAVTLALGAPTRT
ncbi:hypothetical protein PUNSTDRAFT_98024 [Punctularia strigosozonata HHB-11173 SS5]|uniref:uncharacterized protein n=1 Tax=Punctularia strigosozonata (strain HHB-11173) TaxID=741275 RepID=UPI0004416E6B|nr:uncharacterized protein PUNSTDRAFT_98024 [Punctularia strigosozonata HHB-11173 SS5]EIN13007.1 hypothetical protein PUNSTDRAFT_98024 [Punctularia strigosozonata HHB-11173 SS5]